MSTAALTVTDARKHYGRTPALTGASFHLQRGEWLGLLGPNGAGKSTLVKAIAGRVRLDDGTIMLLDTCVAGESAARDDRPSASPADARARLGVVPQEIAIYPLLTARENLEVFGSLAGLAGAALAERVTWALDFAGLADRARDRAGTFSGGMKRRLNIGCSILHRPQVILLDEPTVGVDPQSRERIWQMLAQLRNDGASILLTSHQLDEVERVCDRIVIIDHGQVVAEGTVESLIAATIGRERRVTITLDRAASDVSLNDFTFDGPRAVGRMGNVAAELPAILTQLAERGCRVEDVHIDTPTLQAVFIHLTGRELRE